jgi:ribulose-5-phosphate 4-epimerase/fuculose-1-phosphate aldolase
MSTIAAPAVRTSKPVREQVSPAEWEARVNLAAAYRLTHLYGMTELTGNHISCRVPGEPENFLLNPYGLFYDEIKASSLVKMDRDGKVVMNPLDAPINPAGFVIHSAIHTARHDVDCVAHTHTVAGMAVSALKCGLIPLAQPGMRFANVAYHDFEGIADRMDERERLVADLGDHDAMVLRNHGLLVCGLSIGHAWSLLYRMERACQVQLAAMSCNTELSPPPVEALNRTRDKIVERERARERSAGVQMAWPALLRQLDRVDRSFRD